MLAGSSAVTLVRAVERIRVAVRLDQQSSPSIIHAASKSGAELRRTPQQCFGIAELILPASLIQIPASAPAWRRRCPASRAGFCAAFRSRRACGPREGRPSASATLPFEGSQLEELLERLVRLPSRGSARPAPHPASCEQGQSSVPARSHAGNRARPLPSAAAMPARCRDPRAGVESPTRSVFASRTCGPASTGARSCLPSAWPSSRRCSQPSRAAD